MPRIKRSLSIKRRRILLIKRKKEEVSLAKKAALADEYLNHLKRIKADFENLKKRVERERSEFVKFASEGLIMELLPVLDNLRRAINHSEKTRDIDAFREGIKLIERDFEEVLKKRGLLRLDVIGSNFNPEIHEAIMVKETDEYPEDTIIEEIQAGYKLGGRLLRPALVVVSKSKKKEEVDVSNVQGNRD